jgi:hypothetical protein
VTTVIFSNEVCTTFTVMSSRTLLSHHGECTGLMSLSHIGLINILIFLPAFIVTFHIYDALMNKRQCDFWAIIKDKRKVSCTWEM